MTLNGESYNPHSPLDAYERKISMVVQELGVIDTLSAGANVFLGRTKQFTKYGIVNLKKLQHAAKAIFEKWELPPMQLDQLADGLMIETRKMIELARALSVDPDIMLLDEITQSLSYNNRNRLIELIGKFKTMGKSVVLITHDVEEMIEITDTITVFRDGRVVGELVSAATTPDEVKAMMVGREIDGDYYRCDDKADFEEDVVLNMKNVSVDSELEDVSFEVHKGEILGFCGLSDSGIHSIGRAAFGLSKLSSGSVYLEDKNTTIKNATQAVKNNMAYVPKDRDNEALMIHASIRDNYCLPSYCEMEAKAGYLSYSKQRKLASDLVKDLSVKCTGINQLMDMLSGGNKQKVNLGRWLAKDPAVLILDCPTRGVDVGVKAYIYQLMKETKKKGIATILISDELTEVLGMADRLCIMKNGKITGVVSREDDFSEHSIIGAMI
jgi:ribose transport system ATP-binding protein